MELQSELNCTEIGSIVCWVCYLFPIKSFSLLLHSANLGAQINLINLQNYTLETALQPLLTSKWLSHLLDLHQNVSFSSSQTEESIFFSPFWSFILISTSSIVDVTEICFLSQRSFFPLRSLCIKAIWDFPSYALLKNEYTGKMPSAVLPDPHNNRGQEESVWLCVQELL